MYILELLKNRFSRHDFKTFVRLLFRVLIGKLFGNRRLIFALTTSELKVINSDKAKDYQLKEISSYEMLDESLEDELTEQKRYMCGEPKELLNDGACLWAGIINGRLAHFTWTRQGNKVKRYFFPMTSKCIVISHCATIPEFRGFNFYPLTLAKIIQLLSDRGYKRFYIDCNDWNTASVRGIEHVGFKLIGYGKAKKNNRFVYYQKSQTDTFVQ